MRVRVFVCNEILINHKRSENAIICRKCHNQKRSQKRAKKRRTDCYDEQVSADSKTPISALTDEQKHVRFANIRKVKKEHIRKINKLEQSLKNVKHKIESLTVSLDGSDGTGFLRTENERPTENEKSLEKDDEGEKAHDTFVTELETICTNTTNENESNESYTKMAREAVIGLMKGVVENEKNVKNC